jgi:3-hydroxybutyrate dehydrogenase
MTGILQDRVALVTGAGSGIGREIAEQLAREGARVTLADLDGAAAARAAAALSAQGLAARGVACDVTSEAQFASAISGTLAEGGRLDILVNNAGLQHVALIEEFPTEKFELLIRVMLVGAFVGIKHAFPAMKKQRSGRIINIASVNGLVGFAGKAGYNSAKHGLIGLTKVAALEGAAHGITVNALCPGYVDTPLVRNQFADLARTRNVPLERVLEEVLYPLVPMRRLLSTREVADYAVFLASDRAAAITGSAVVIDGGYTAQ